MSVEAGFVSAQRFRDPIDAFSGIGDWNRGAGDGVPGAWRSNAQSYPRAPARRRSFY